MTKMGRPKEDNAKRKSITVRLSEKTHAELTRYAAEHKMTKTEVALWQRFEKKKSS